MANLNSQNILVFPSTKRGTKQVSARLMTESSMVSVVNRLLDTYGFVSTEDPINFSAESTTPFEFNIFGYYFKVLNANAITSLFSNASVGNGIYASIQLIRSGDYIEVNGQDETEDVTPTEQSIYTYTGVNFSLEASPDTEQASSYDPISNTYKLLLFVRALEGWQVLDISRKKFNFEGVTDVDGGEIISS